MGKRRCKETSLNSFFGTFLYEQKVAKDHFLRKVNEIIEWDRFTDKLLDYYKGKGEIGQAPYDPVIMLKMLLLCYLWDTSERMIEALANDSLSVGLFLEVGAHEKVPDHSTLSLFKKRLIDNVGLGAYEDLFNEIVKIAQEKGVKFGKLQIVDSLHLLADVNLAKERQRRRQGEEPRDRDATWGAKGNKVVETGEGREKRTEYFYGYKDQVSLNAESELVTTVLPGRADDYDGSTSLTMNGHKLKKLVEKDIEKGIEMGTLTADKGYDDGENHYYLKVKGINSAIRLNSHRTQKKDKNKEGWIKLKESEAYKAGLKLRYQIERKFGEARKWHGFIRCRYLGFVRHAIQTYFTFMALNLKRLVKLLTGVCFRAEPLAVQTG